MAVITEYQKLCGKINDLECTIKSRSQLCRDYEVIILSTIKALKTNGMNDVAKTILDKMDEARGRV